MGNPYIKEIIITTNNQPAFFKFKIIYRGSDYIGGEYIIYPIRYPGMNRYNSTSHEAHLLTDENGNPYICWDSTIETFQDANAIMFVWAKNYAKMYFGNTQGRHRPTLPSGTFRNQ